MTDQAPMTDERAMHALRLVCTDYEGRTSPGIDLVLAHIESRLRAGGEAVAYVPVHPRTGPLWAETFARGTDVSQSKPTSYPFLALYAAPPRAPVAEGAMAEVPVDVARPMASAPLDGTSVLLLIADPEHALDDENPSWTIGSYGVDGGPEDDPTWTFAGWCWQHDHYTRGIGRVVGWRPLPLTGAALSRPAAEVK